MSTFDGSDFSERRSEEVTSFFWRSLYEVGVILKFFFLFSFTYKQHYNNPFSAVCIYKYTQTIHIMFTDYNISHIL